MHKRLGVTLVVILLVMTVFLSYNKPKYAANKLGTVSTPEDAVEEVTKALKMISLYMNKASKTFNYLGKLDEGQKSFRHLNKVENAVQTIFKPTTE